MVCVLDCCHCVLCVHKLTCCTVLGKESSKNATGERKLFADIFSSYVSEVRPRIDPTQNVTVFVDVDLNHIKQMVKQM